MTAVAALLIDAPWWVLLPGFAVVASLAVVEWRSGRPDERR
jgi:ABC-type antimicrobial peptide transport system permease subunit